MKTSLFSLAALAGVSALKSEGVVEESIFHRPHHFETLPYSSGSLAVPEVTSTDTVVVMDETFTFSEGAPWTQLFFDEQNTFISENDVDACTLKLWSTEDMKPQLLNAHTIKQWGFRSAEFTGNEIRMQVLCAGGDKNLSVSVAVTGADVGEQYDAPATKSLCHSSDLREATTINRSGRYVPGGSCTGWILTADDQPCMFTAGHCTGVGRMEFNVPLQGSADPKDQYPVDSTSIQSANGGVGNDWKSFGCFSNSNTGLTAYDVQDDTYTVYDQNNDRYTHMSHVGFGSASTSLNLKQKGQPGGSDNVGITGTSLSYRFDTTGGDSGSGVSVHADFGPLAIGVHTHGGCSPNGSGSNKGTHIYHPNIQDALRNPRGVCAESVSTKVAAETRTGVHFRGDVNAHGPCALDCAYAF